MELDADAPTRAEAAANLGRVAMESGADPAEATRQLERAIELHPQHRGALQALRELHTRTGNWNSLVGVLAREASIAPEDRRLPWYVEIAKVWQDHIGNARVAVSSWQKVLQEDPQHAEAIERLLQLYEKQGDWKGYLDTADRGIGKLSGFALRERQAELGAVAQEKAHDVERAVAYYRAATSGDLPVPKALEALRRVARSRGDWESVISLSEQEVEIAPDAASKVALLEEAARIKLDQLLDRDGAAGLFRRALALDPQCGSALSFFVNYLFDNESWEEALPVFRNYEPMIERMDIEGDDDARIEATAYYYKFGAVLGKAGEEGDALRRFARALELTPTHLPSLESAAPRWFEAGDWTRAAETYRQILKLRGGTGDAAALTQLYLRLGQAELRVGDPQNAIKRFKKALDQTPNHVEALQGIAQIHRLGEDWNSLLSTYNSIIKYARDPDQVIEAYMTKGDVLEQKLQFTDKAVLHYEKVLMYDKSNVAAMTRLGEIALRRGESGRAVDLGAQAARAAQVTDEKIQGLLLERIAQGGDQIDVQGVLEAVRHAAGDGDALAAFRVAAGGREQLDRMEAASAYREAFRTL
jgi:tetratricopeptide (TPR) repeat protein